MTLKISVLGCGYWGKNHIRNFSELGLLHSVFDPNQALAQKFSKEYDVPTLFFDSILEDSTCEGVVMATPAATHASLAERALKAGKHVFIEKPLTLNISEAENLCNLAQLQKKILMVGHILQYHKAYIKLKELIKEGKLGKIQYIYSNRLNLGKIRAHESIWWDLGPHDISMILGLTEELPTKVLATGSSLLTPHIEDITLSHLYFKSGIEAHIHASRLHPFKQQILVVIGDKGMAAFDDCLNWDQKLALYPYQVVVQQGLLEAMNGEREYIPLEPDEPLKRECMAFINSIYTGIPPITDGKEGLRVLQVLTATQQSIVEGRPVTFNELQMNEHTLEEIVNGS